MFQALFPSNGSEAPPYGTSRPAPLLCPASSRGRPMDGLLPRPAAERQDAQPASDKPEPSSDTLTRTAIKRAIVEERNRIARDMHDTLASGFTGALMQIEAAKEVMRTDPALAEACLDRATAAVREGLRQSRYVVFDLSDLHSESLPSSLPDLVRQGGGASRVTCSFELHGTPRRLPAAVDHQVFLICQEAFVNARRYAEATHITVALSFTQHTVSVLVEDDGQGFVPAAAEDIGFGLSGMKKRADRIGARLQIESCRECGTTVRLIWRDGDDDGRG